MRCSVAYYANGTGRCVRDEGHFPSTKHSLEGAHHCHARGCLVETKPEMLMCLRHWRKVPKALQRRVWATYRPGQCDDRDVSREWLSAADEAIDYVHAIERKADGNGK